MWGVHEEDAVWTPHGSQHSRGWGRRMGPGNVRLSLCALPFFIVQYFQRICSTFITERMVKRFSENTKL